MQKKGRLIMIKEAYYNINRFIIFSIKLLLIKYAISIIRIVEWILLLETENLDMNLKPSLIKNCLDFLYVKQFE